MKHQHPPHQHAGQHAQQHSCGCNGAAASTLAALPAAQGMGELLRTPIRILQMDCPPKKH
ncbi:hypothetical protein [Aquitalea magnusonii]|uniref:hypothetical protein n=1 Tax=Aquitalea magnusonii TaxID=332411 RepID=UPI00128F0D35|nr:hypothetical protein [Aquitalea magnusonii]